MGTGFHGGFGGTKGSTTCWFNHEQEKADKEIMLDLIQRIRVRLDEINDGSFAVEDFETPRLNNL